MENKFFKNLQNKPEPIKKTIMWFGVFFVMAAIFIFWLMTFPSQIPSVEENDETANLKKELPTVFNSLKSQAGEIFNLLK